MTIRQRVWTIIASLWELDLDSWPPFYCIMRNIKGRSRNLISCTVFRGWKIVELRSSNNLVKNSVRIQLGRAWDPQVMEFSLFLWLHFLVSGHLHEAASILDILPLGRIRAISGPLRCRGLGRGAAEIKMPSWSFHVWQLLQQSRSFHTVRRFVKICWKRESLQICQIGEFSKSSFS